MIYLLGLKAFCSLGLTRACYWVGAIRLLLCVFAIDQQSDFCPCSFPRLQKSDRHVASARSGMAGLPRCDGNIRRRPKVLFIPWPATSKVEATLHDCHSLNDSPGYSFMVSPAQSPLQMPSLLGSDVKRQYHVSLMRSRLRRVPRLLAGPASQSTDRRAIITDP